MDIYARKEQWKWWLGAAGVLIVMISLFYTNYIVRRLKEEEVKRVELYSNAMRVYVNEPIDDLPEGVRRFLSEILRGNTTIPVVLTDEQYNFVDAINIVDSIQTAQDTATIVALLNELKKGGAKPLEVKIGDTVVQNVFFDDSKLLVLLKYYPFFQFLLIALFIGFGYAAFSAARRSEQNQVWVGMAKETAHQLGTPIAAILGWIEHLRVVHEGETDTEEVLDELNNDVNRLSLVADRFSKIGSTPELGIENIYETLDRCRDYMQKRAPRRVIFAFPATDNIPINVAINAHLFDWVIENLLRNAIDAMENGEGKIMANVLLEPNFVCIELTDTGKGIPRNKFIKVFEPGFTTKKRGWGLGLSLAKRIIENYHNGKIYVKDSEINAFTTFMIKLPSKINN